MTDKPAVTAEAEAERLLPRIRVGPGGALYSVIADECRPAVAAALAAKNAEISSHVASIAALEAELSALTTPRPESEWHEDFGDVLWWILPIEEPPYVGSPLDSDWVWVTEVDGDNLGAEVPYYTHWTPIKSIADAIARTALSAQPGGE